MSIPFSVEPNSVNFQKLDVLLENPPLPFTEGELHVITDVLTNPIIKRYLDTLLWNTIRDLASLPIDKIGTPEGNNHQVYTKGALGMLITLGSIKKPQPRRNLKKS